MFYFETLYNTGVWSYGLLECCRYIFHQHIIQGHIYHVYLQLYSYFGAHYRIESENCHLHKSIPFLLPSSPCHRCINYLPPLPSTGGLDISSNLTTTLTLAPGVDMQCLEVDVLDDSLEEESEVLVIQVNSLSPVGTVIMGQETVRLIVMDNDETGVYSVYVE